jgi:hypothetical protein
MTFLLQFPFSGLSNTLNEEIVVNKKSRASDCTALTSNDYNSTNNKLSEGNAAEATIITHARKNKLFTGLF